MKTNLTRIESLLDSNDGGDLISIWKDEEGSMYLIKWVDMIPSSPNNEGHNIWLISKISSVDLEEYKNKRMDLRSLITRSSVHYLWESNVVTEYSKVTVKYNNSEDIPEEYLPYPNTYYNED